MKQSNKKKITLCAFLAAASCLALGVSNLSPVGMASANGVELSASEFAMDNGASVRLAETGGSGIRFGFSIAKSAWTKLETAYPASEYTYKVYTMIDKTDNEQSGEALEIVQEAVVFGENEETKPFYATIIYDELDAEYEDLAFALSLTANTYIDVIKTSDGSVAKTFEADNNGQSRSIREVAWKLMEQGLISGAVAENYRGEVADAVSEQNFDAWGETFTATVSGNVYGVYLNDYNTKVDTYSVSEGKLSLAWENVEESYNAQTVIVITDAGVSSYPCAPIYNMTQANAYKLRHISMENVDNKQCNVFVTEDIDMSQVTWDVAFNTWYPKSYYLNFDGQGHTISNLATTKYENNGVVGVGLFDVFVGTMKDVAFVNCTATQQAGGALIGTLRSTTFENVYIEVATTGSFWNKTWDPWGGIARFVDANQNVVMNNVYISMPASTGTQAFVVGKSNGASDANAATFNMTNCVFVGGNQDALVINAEQGVATVNGAATYCEDIISAYENYYGKTDFVATTFNSKVGTTITPIANNADDITKLLSATSGYFLLVEDIDLAGRTDALVSFTGTLNGNGHTIKNVTPRGTGNKAGLWHDFYGPAVIKNVALELTELSANCGGIAYASYAYNGTPMIENVYVKIASYGNGINENGYSGALVRAFYAGQTIVRNVVVEMPETDNSYAALISGQAVQGQCNFVDANCYFIGGCFVNDAPVLSITNPNLVSTAAAYAYENRDEFATAYGTADSGVTLTKELKAWLGL